MSSTLSGAGLRWWMWGSAAGSLVAALAGVWLTPLRGWFHALFIRFGAEWFGPLLVGLALCVLLPAVAMAIVLASDNFASTRWRTKGFESMLRVLIEAPPRQERDPFSVVRRDAWRAPVPYHPGVPLCGMAAGSALGVAVLAAVIGAQVVPLELDTLGVLLRAEARLDSGWSPSLRPRPTGESTLLAGDGATAEPVLDGFGNAISYERSDSSDGVAYTLRSLGQDGKWSSDDLCVHGGTGIDSRAPQPDRVEWADRLAMILQARCTTSRSIVARAGQLRAD
jgi:hypothetical protein